MVSSQLTQLNKTDAHKSLHKRLMLSVVHTDSISSEQRELDFSDVFGPMPDQASLDVNPVDEVDSVSGLNPKGNVYDDPLVILNRSHSLVGPAACVRKSFTLSAVNIHESDSVLELKDCIQKEIGLEFHNQSIDESLKMICCNGVEAKKDGGVGLDDFEVLKLVGQGAFGKVFQVRKKDTSEIYAMKVMRKDKIMEKNHAEYMKAERDILTKVDHPFVVQLRYSFQTKYRLYLVLDFVNGGHLFFQLYHHGLFREDLARIYTAEIVSAVSHLHANGIMHRDLKPENILLDADGHAMLTDFGLAKQFEENTRSNSMCGTVEYMAPEIILGKGHDKAADWWSVGILMFEMLTGKPPFVGKRQKIQQKIVKDKIKLPSYLSGEAHTLLKGLLQKEASKRLGSGPGGSNDIKNHRWFKSINWRKLESREVEPSFRPNVAGQLCVANFEEKWTNMPLSDSPVGSPVGACNFVGFSYVKPSPLRRFC